MTEFRDACLNFNLDEVKELYCDNNISIDDHFVDELIRDVFAKLNGSPYYGYSHDGILTIHWILCTFKRYNNVDNVASMFTMSCEHNVMSVVKYLAENCKNILYDICHDGILNGRLLREVCRKKQYDVARIILNIWPKIRNDYNFIDITRIIFQCDATSLQLLSYYDYPHIRPDLINVFAYMMVFPNSKHYRNLEVLLDIIKFTNDECDKFLLNICQNEYIDPNIIIWFINRQRFSFDIILHHIFIKICNSQMINDANFSLLKLVCDEYYVDIAEWLRHNDKDAVIPTNLVCLVDCQDVAPILSFILSRFGDCYNITVIDYINVLQILWDKIRKSTDIEKMWLRIIGIIRLFPGIDNVLCIFRQENPIDNFITVEICERYIGFICIILQNRDWHESSRDYSERTQYIMMMCRESFGKIIK